MSQTEPLWYAPRQWASQARAVLRRRATWVLVDQGVVSLGNFLTTNLLIRKLPTAEYGTFAVLFETLLYLNGLQAALIIYPLTIKGATGGRHCLGRLSTASVLLTVALLPVLGGATALSIGVLGSWRTVPAAVAALLLWQVQETLRRALMADLRFADAVWGDLVRYLGQVVAIFLLARYSTLSLSAAFLVMAAAAMVATIVQAIQIGLAPLRWVQLLVIAKRFWRSGRWMLLTNATGIVTGLGFWWVLRGTHGPEECAVFGAIVAMLKLANPVMSSMSGLIMPAVARAQEQEGMPAARRQALRYTAVGAGLLAPYFLLLAVLPGPSLRLFYGADSPYVASAVWLALFVANYTVAYLGTTTSAWLAGLGRSRDTFVAQAAGVVATVVVGLPATAIWGVGGLVLGGLFSSAAATVMTLYLIRRAEAHPAQSAA